ncbi:putative monovalent cation/H+ antiporter subunit E [Rubripirellula tenax]|uniref:Putative monovalent cation/H+ antiporter subunit E n=1 Tax=Rubripirellula tenax TaxID=2528015 RepID=A0A5C6FGR7_9BACT|nr:Na+/H+ antiporter subunit E [Rubripirellula tenax]TWU60691.1 putative monovalent cation/H+ antiporter subunit E [Rubripirellula tenax]
MKYTISLGVALLANWLLWSGHFDNPFLLGLGFGSCVLSLWLSARMRIVDEEGAPAQLGLRPFTQFAPWLAFKIVESNVHVAKIILSRDMPLNRNVVTIQSNQKSALGRVILANSITLTPGTVSVDLIEDKIMIHALSISDADEDMSGDIDRRICRLERSE